uniref:Uncharacterized protein n=1 Tax=Rhizophora mucronata TaxID=61149 RepID=A0A2P2NA91_RHIMU
MASCRSVWWATIASIYCWWCWMEENIVICAHVRNC